MQNWCKPSIKVGTRTSARPCNMIKKSNKISYKIPCRPMKEFYEKLLTKFLLVFLKFSSSFFGIFMLHHSLLNKFSVIEKKKKNFWPHGLRHSELKLTPWWYRSKISVKSVQAAQTSFLLLLLTFSPDASASSLWSVNKIILFLLTFNPLILVKWFYLLNLCTKYFGVTIQMKTL